MASLQPLSLTTEVTSAGASPKVEKELSAFEPSLGTLAIDRNPDLDVACGLPGYKIPFSNFDYVTYASSGVVKRKRP